MALEDSSNGLANGRTSGNSDDDSEAEEGADPGEILDAGLKVAAAYIRHLAKFGGDLDHYQAGAVAKLLPSVNVIRRDEANGNGIGDKTPEEIAEEMAKALGPDAMAAALVGLVGEPDALNLVRIAAKRQRAQR